jgi:hypothetical protein
MEKNKVDLLIVYIRTKEEGKSKPYYWRVSYPATTPNSNLNLTLTPNPNPNHKSDPNPNP